MDKKEFIDSIKEGALKGQREYNILASLTIAQAILESGWGSSELSQRANNLFGIKAFSNWKGRRITIPTTEWYSGKMTVINADFRAYDSLTESIEDHNKLLTNTRYNPVRECTDYKSACQSIIDCGYATDPEYADKLIRLIEENKLYEFDSTQMNQEAAVDTISDKIQRFQALCNKLNIKDIEGKALAEDNKLGPRTRSCIAKMPVLKIGSQGAAVEFVQEQLGAKPIDGDFGHITEKCVIEYQRGKGLIADGIVGPKTWNVIVTT